MLSRTPVSTNCDPVYIRVVKEGLKRLEITEGLQFYDFHLPTLYICMFKLLFLDRLGHSSPNSGVAKPCFRVRLVAWKLSADKSILLGKGDMASKMLSKDT